MDENSSDNLIKDLPHDILGVICEYVHGESPFYNTDSQKPVFDRWEADFCLQLHESKKLALNINKQFNKYY